MDDEKRPHVGYTKTTQSKLIRTRHLVAFSDNYTAGDLMDALKQVPAAAKLLQVIDDSNYSDPFLCTIEFVEEKETNVPDMRT